MREKLTIGSHAAKHWFPDYREPKDIDFISKEGKMSRLEQHYWIDTFQEILDRNGDNQYIDPDFLYTLKVSHAGWDIHWSKTMGDILFLKSKGCKLDKKLYKKLVKDWIGVHGRKWAKLEGNDSDTFFKDAVKRKYVHDDIHEAVAVYDEPLYFRILKDDSGSVGCCQKKFNKLSELDKELLVREEVWVTALERYLVPSNFTYGNKLAYFRSLKKLCTTMSSGWFKMWILDNYDRLFKPGDNSFVDRFKKAERENKIRLDQ